MSVIYQVMREDSTGRVHGIHANTNRVDAETALQEFKESVAKAGGKNKRYWVEEVDTTGMWQIPSPLKPRDRYTTRTNRIDKGLGYWPYTHVEVLEGEKVIAEYQRNYAMLRTFEPFRQGDHNYALISSDYTATSVLDLQTGEVIAGEERDSGGFCPVGFYVPDWWDIHDGSIIPGSWFWNEDDEWPIGDFGFVWGCVWGDDSSWKVQYLDLSQIAEGVITRDDRFGYVELATTSSDPEDFLACWSEGGRKEVQMHVVKSFDLVTGKARAEE